METPGSRIYVGRFQEEGPVVYAVGATDVDQLRPIAGSFDWGAEAKASSVELARVLLTDASGSEPPPNVCQRFANQILSKLPRDGFALQRETVNAWLRRATARERP
ncbi:MAG: DUF6166 domain-containing protein [Thermoleophilaceae bacterium]